MTVHDFKERFGRYYEQFTVGDVFKHWPGKTINEHDNDLFSLLTMNHMPLHIDKAYAEKSPHKQRLVVGLLVLSLAVGMSVVETSGKAVAALEYEEVKHLGPTFIGDTIYASTEILEKRLLKSDQSRGIVRVQTTVTNQRGEKIMTLKRSFMVYSEEAGRKAGV
ncbi:MAG: MaoC family dehydratase [Chloroflexi bacterium]|nr:MaoC family dehydratase [Chloroflexota bacterium]